MWFWFGESLKNIFSDISKVLFEIQKHVYEIKDNQVRMIEMIDTLYNENNTTKRFTDFQDRCNDLIQKVYELESRVLVLQNRLDSWKFTY